jgi:hypothetical protein
MLGATPPGQQSASLLQAWSASEQQVPVVAALLLQCPVQHWLLELHCLPSTSCPFEQQMLCRAH